jgi:hypothetical protein
MNDPAWQQQERDEDDEQYDDEQQEADEEAARAAIEEDFDYIRRAGCNRPSPTIGTTRKGSPMIL